MTAGQCNRCRQAPATVGVEHDDELSDYGRRDLVVCSACLSAWLDELVPLCPQLWPIEGDDQGVGR